VTPTVREKLFSVFPRVRMLTDEMNNDSAKTMDAFKEISSAFRDNNIDFLLIKSAGHFPFESDNLDTLVKPESFKAVSELLLKKGYSELPHVRERHKFLFRRINEPDLLPLHIHTRVEWEGTGFVESSPLWRRCKSIEGKSGFYVPSPEDCILITCAHFFFENHEIKLTDLLKIASRIRDYSLDWDYMLDHASKLHWNDAFCLSLLLTNNIFKELSGTNLIGQETISKIEIRSPTIKPLQKILIPFNSESTLLNIPYNLSVLFFVHRILQESTLPLKKRLKHLDWVASNVLREKCLRQ
jgi:hypothetical protein